MLRLALQLHSRSQLHSRLSKASRLGAFGGFMGVKKMQHRTLWTRVVVGGWCCGVMAGLATTGFGEVFPNRRARTYGFGVVTASPGDSTRSVLGVYGNHTPEHRNYYVPSVRLGLGQVGGGTPTMSGLRRANYLDMSRFAGSRPVGVRYESRWSRRSTLSRWSVRNRTRH